MKNKFSNKWKESRQPRKKKKYAKNAPLHIKKKFMRARLSKELRKKYGKRNIGLRKGDKVKIMTGKFKKKDGKIENIYLKIGKITIEGIQRKKRDGSKIDIKIDPSNLEIIELNLNEGNREKDLKKETIIKQDKNEKITDKK